MNIVPERNRYSKPRPMWTLNQFDIITFIENESGMIARNLYYNCLLLTSENYF